MITLICRALRLRRERLLLAAASWILIPLGAVAVGSEIHQIVQADRKFQASAITIVRGDLVRFTNSDPYVHQIYVNSPTFEYESSMQPPDKIIELRFPAPGAFQVMCHIHPTMRLTVIVQ